MTMFFASEGQFCGLAGSVSEYPIHHREQSKLSTHPVNCNMLTVYEDNVCRL